jgi:hypothetical protein
MIQFYRLLAIILRVGLYYSPIVQKISDYFMYDPLPYSIKILKDNSYLFKNYSQMINSAENYFSVIYFFKCIYISQV